MTSKSKTYNVIVSAQGTVTINAESEWDARETYDIKDVDWEDVEIEDVYEVDEEGHPV